MFSEFHMPLYMQQLCNIWKYIWQEMMEILKNRGYDAERVWETWQLHNQIYIHMKQIADCNLSWLHWLI